MTLRENRQQYIFITEKEISNCKRLEGRYLVCRQTQPIYLSHIHEDCAVKLFLPADDIPKVISICIKTSGYMF